MENYKADYYNPETFEKSEIETTIPINLVNKVKQTLDSMEGYMVTPTLVNPENNSVVFGIMDMSDKTLNIKLHFDNKPSFVPEFWLVDDFILENYESHPPIKAPLSN